MITRLKINNFKSLVNFDIPLAKFTCLVGMNGAGKSNVLQAINFLSHVILGEVRKWLDNPHNSGDYSSKLNSNDHGKISFLLELELDNKNIIWEGSFINALLNWDFEKIVADGVVLLEVSNDFCNIIDNEKIALQFNYSGSILPQLRENTYIDKAPILKKILKFIAAVRSLEKLSPYLMKKTEGKVQGGRDVGVGGEGVANFFLKIYEEERERIVGNIKELFAPQLLSITPIAFDGPYLVFREKFTDSNTMEFIGMQHMSDGLLRQIAIISQTGIDHSVLLFDEIENGMNPEIIDKLVKFLIECPQQVIVTSHNPLFMNYIPDNVAKEGMIFLYRNRKGYSQGVRFFDLPVPAKKLTLLGPGEVYTDCYLENLIKDLEEQNGDSSLETGQEET